jgi:hypothetical protein
VPHVEWSMQGVEYNNCNCNWGCPCQFNALPSHGDCRALGFFQIDKGHFGNVPLDGLRWGIFASWPKAVHMGNGTFQTVVDARADERQRAAIEAVSHGRETDAGSLIWQVFSTTITTWLPTLVKPIDLSIDVSAGTASLRVPGLVTGGAKPITNPVTGAAHRPQLTLPKGFEFTTAEMVSGTASSTGDIGLDFHDTHAHLAPFHWSNHGVVR